MKNNDKRVAEEQKDSRERIYVCAPLRTKARDPEQAKKELAENMRRAKSACRMITDLGGKPVCIHKIFALFLEDDDVSTEHWRVGELGYEFMKGCDELWCFSSRITEDMVHEIGMASRLGLPVRMFTSDTDGLVSRLLGGIPR